MTEFVQSCLKIIHSFCINHILRQHIPCIHYSITKEIFTNIQAKTILTILYACPLTLESPDNLKNKL